MTKHKMNNRENIVKAHRIVIKVGTKVLTTKNAVVDVHYIHDLARQIAKLMRMKKHVVLVSSGAIGLGAMSLKATEKLHAISMRQACASVGQLLLMHEYKKAFEQYGITIAQVLLSRVTFNSRSGFLALKNNLETLFSLSVLPILNANDSVSTLEIDAEFGDNDILSAMVASKLDAQLLLILSTIPGMYARYDARRDVDKESYCAEEKKPISEVHTLSRRIWQAAGPSHDILGSGGMISKLKAVEIARKAACATVLAYGREKNVLARVLSGEEIGTFFSPGKKIRYKKRWILHSQEQGKLCIDEGAMKALHQQKSLLSKGVLSVEGVFDIGAVLSVNEQAKLISNLSSKEIETLIGEHSSEISEQLGNNRKLIARPEHIVFLDET